MKLCVERENARVDTDGKTGGEIHGEEKEKKRKKYGRQVWREGDRQKRAEGTLAARLPSPPQTRLGIEQLRQHPVALLRTL